MTRAHTLVGVTIFFTIVQIVLGAVVRLTDSGLSCPDWPLCYGLWIPTPDKLAMIPDMAYSFGQVMAEWVHRLNAAAVVGPLMLISAVLAWRMARTPEAAGQPIKLLVLASLLVLLIQGGLGGLTVLDRNSPWSVAVHLSTALVFLALLVWLRRTLSPNAGWDAPFSLSWLGLMVLLLVLAVMASGAMMAKSGASLGCSDWPLCDDRLIPDMTDPSVRIHMTHRLLAAIAAIAIVGYAGARRAWAVMIVLGIQILLGAGVVHIFAGPALSPQVAMGAVHQAVGVVLFALLAGLAVNGRSEP